MKKKLIWISICLVPAVLLFCPAVVNQGSKDGLLLWFTVVLPALFPFMVFSGTMMKTGAAGEIGHLLYPFLHRLLGLSENGCYAMAVEFLSGRFSEEPNLEELAERCGMSRTLFFRTFREETGMTPGEFRLRRRIREAQKLLLQGKLTVSEIAATLGWESPFHFSRIFKRETGFSPGDFRKRR